MTELLAAAAAVAALWVFAASVRPLPLLARRPPTSGRVERRVERQR